MTESKKYFHPDRDWFVKHKAVPPSVATHGTEEDVRSNLKPVKMTNWRLEGNRLIAQTELGEVVNFISPDLILRGTDDNGLPILDRIKV